MRSYLMALWALVLIVFAGATPAVAADYSEIVLPFPQSRPYSAKYDAVDNTVRVEILKTSSTELGALERYDEELVRRVLVKDRAADGVELLIKLKSRDAVATVNDYDEPFRIVVAIFKRGYTPLRTATGIPVTDGMKDSVTESRVSGPVALSAKNPPAEVAAPASNTAQAPQRKLFQPAPKKFESAADLCAHLKQAKPGRAANWDQFADPVYRLDSLPAKPQFSGDIPVPVCERAMASTKGMSDLAALLFADGQELRAMAVYQQLLFHDPLAIEKDPSSLWRMAEIHLGQGNLSLAGGYYEAIVRRFPGTPEHGLASMRLIDVQALEAKAAGETDLFAKASPRLSSLDLTGATPDYRAGKVLRTAFWRPAQGESSGKSDVPVLEEMEARELESAFAGIKHPRTRFLAASLLLGTRLDAKREWNTDTANFAANYFRDYKTAEFDPMRQELSGRLRSRLDAMLQKMSLDGRHVDAVQTFELLPKPLQSIRKNPKTAWALGESYRGIGQPQPAVAFYEIAATEGSGIDRFKAEFWLAQTASDAADLLARMKAAQTRISPLQRRAIEADRAMAATFAGLKAAEREQLYATFRQPLESSVDTAAKLRTPPKIILSAWKDHHAARQTTSAGSTPSDTKNEFAPSAASAKLISSLAARFGVMGMEKERRESLGLLRGMKPSQFGEDKEARKAWMDQLLQLADEYRKDNEYLDAGRIYSLVASESENWEGRAETLYKAGLLLYRAGRKDEAIAALEKAKGDGNNLFYANLATERLNQIQKK